MATQLVTINQILETIENLDQDDRNYLLEMLYKRSIESRRMEIAERAKEAEIAFREGKVKVGTVDDLWRDLND